MSISNLQGQLKVEANCTFDTGSNVMKAIQLILATENASSMAFLWRITLLPCVVSRTCAVSGQLSVAMQKDRLKRRRVGNLYQSERRDQKLT